MVPIVEMGIVSATTADLLAGGRLNSLPRNGQLTIQLLSDLATAANQYTVTIQLPNGDVPVDAQLVPANDTGVVGVMRQGQLFSASYFGPQGGHFNITLTETGTAVCSYRIVLR